MGVGREAFDNRKMGSSDDESPQVRGREGDKSEDGNGPAECHRLHEGRECLPHSLILRSTD